MTVKFTISFLQMNFDAELDVAVKTRPTSFVAYVALNL